MANGDAIKDNSPYPSASEMDLDMWRAGKPSGSGARPIVDTSDKTRLAEVLFQRGNPSARDSWARRIEMIGDLYEGLRRAAEKMAEKGMDVSDENQILSEFVAPKPFAEGQ